MPPEAGRVRGNSMFDRILSLLAPTKSKPAPLPEPDARMALGALLVRVAMADEIYLFEEIEQIDRILSAAYDLNPIEAARLRAMSEKLNAATAGYSTEDLASLIRDSVDYAHRRDTVAALWRVVQADGFTHANEADLVTLVQTQLGVTKEDNEFARNAAS